MDTLFPSDSLPADIPKRERSGPTHADLVARAGGWLRGTIGCKVVLLEQTSLGEHPDAIGWRSSRSFLVECKVSRSDFLADQKKGSRRMGPEFRPAFQCYYMTPPGLVKAEDVPEYWGLLWAEGRRVRVVKFAKPESDHHRQQPSRWRKPLSEGFPGDDRDSFARHKEFERLYQELRRYQAQGIRYKSGLDLMGVDCLCGRRRYSHEVPCKQCGGNKFKVGDPSTKVEATS